ncbi:UDP-glucose 4-epimerase-like [Adelges cooleyi]|uniref:UDP-glucose 4-epimerase-like n=1 Tax=Adelges cooleyi TaxID=133065 RepID=UPI00217F8FAE|nr:UDP-glucose 4-epimerase-like [Adelges cooleyi]XP_050443441.1 UDP-glucose 4-epimerase-like [Adelges cooleyi]XP_050443442.1 UDP-glucose 4-epimerase-like [Adelges cooleyi]XP_050443443.1 UDP-glucose 4-epimerase-like [Adelges cooleyi]XP_050443444.1 UDP-glucose 4-epimerase-like [Adelges cooleyi]
MNTTKSQCVLLTGGAGYVGSHTIIPLIESGYEVVVLDNLSNACKGLEGQKPVPITKVEELTGKEVTFYNVDLLNSNSVSEVFDKHDFCCVIHFAGLKAVGESCHIPLTYYRVNVSGSINLLEVMKAHNVKKLVFSSSSTVYGEPQFLPITEAHSVGNNLLNGYAKSKYYIEGILQDLCNSDKDWSVIILRYFNPVGAHPSGNLGEDPTGIPNNLMPFVAQVAVGSRPCLQVFGNDYDTVDGTGVRDYLHIMDLAEGHVSAVKKLQTNNKNGAVAINLGTGNGYSVLQVIDMFSQVSGRKIPYEIVGRRQGDCASSYCDASFAKDYLGWEAKRTLKEMCQDTWKWQSLYPQGFSTLK